VVGAHLPVATDEADLPGVGKVFLEQPLHLRGEASILGHQVYLPVGGQAAEVEVGRAYLRKPAVCDEGLGVDHRSPVLEYPDP
jgi:hypothetical protein